MQIDLSNKYTVEDVAALLKSGDDTSHTQLRVSSTGKAYLSKDVGSDNLDGVALRLETWIAGNSYVGVDASNDAEWVERVFNALQQHWPNPASSYVDLF